MRIFFVLMVVLACTSGSFAQVDRYLELLSKVWEISSSELAKNKEGRSILRGYVAEVRSAYELALVQCGNDTGYLDYNLRQRYEGNMLQNFVMDTSGNHERMIATLPRSLQTTNSPFPNDPYVVDSRFFEELFNLRTSWATIFFHNNQELKLIFKRYKQLWMKRNRDSRNLLSEVIYMWYDIRLERIVSLVTEWEIRGIRTDEEDVWPDEISSDILPDAVLNLLDNNVNYQLRMFYHNLVINSRLFYGLPVGTRLPSSFSTEQVDLAEAERKVTEEAKKLDRHHGDQGMEKLGKIVNRYLRAKAQKNKIAVTTTPVRSIDEPSCSHWDAPETIQSCVSEEVLQQAGSSSMDIDSINSTTTINSSDDLNDGLRLDLMMDCLDPSKHLDNNSKRFKRHALKSTSSWTLQYQKYKMCSESVNFCKKTVRQKPVQDPSSLVRHYSKELKDKSHWNVSCDNNQILRVADAQVHTESSFLTVAETVGLVFLPKIAFAHNQEDMSKKTLEFIKKKCDKKSECSVGVNVEKTSGHTSVYDLKLNVDYECAPRGCNPNLYVEKSVTADKGKPLIWQCNDKNEGIMITSVEWKRKDGFWEGAKTVLEVGVPLVAFDYNNSDMNLETLKYLRKYCSGRNKCDQMADLDGITNHSTDYEVFVEVKYKCLPCKEFLRKKWMDRCYV